MAFRLFIVRVGEIATENGALAVAKFMAMHGFSPWQPDQGPNVFMGASSFEAHELKESLETELEDLLRIAVEMTIVPFEVVVVENQ